MKLPKFKLPYWLNSYDLRASIVPLCYIAAALALLVVIIIAIPIFTIRSVNLVFNAEIPETFRSWAAIWWLIFMFGWLNMLRIQKN